MLAKEIMTTNVYKVRDESTVEEVARLLVEKHISGVPVVNDRNELVGIVTEGDLIIKDKKVKVPSAVQILGSVIYLDSIRQFEEDLRRLVGTKVKDVMSSPVYTATESTPVEDLATVMVEKGINRVPITRSGNIVGIVSRADIIRSMTE